MKIVIHGWRNGSFREVGFTDFENEEITAYTGLLGPAEATELALRLSEVADELAQWAREDERQGLLPFAAAA